MWVTCALGPYNFEFMTAVHREVMKRYKVDGIFINRWAGSGMCYCAHCRDGFRAATGHDLPRTDDPQDPARRAHILWQQERLFELWRLWDGEVRTINPDSRVIPNAGGGATSPLDMKAIGELAPTLFADRQARSGLMPPWANGKAAKEYRAAMGKKPVGGIFSVGVEEAYRWKDSVQSEAEVRIWFADGVANGLRPWFTKFGGVLRDRRWLGVVEDLYRWHHGAERYLRNEEPLARVGLVYSQQTAWFYGGPEAGEKVEDHALGWYQALVEARIPFEMVHDRLLDEAHLAPLKTLLLPNIAALSDEQCRQLRAFVERGGGLVATGETSLYDERGERRADFGLAELFGVTFRRRADGPMRNAYLRLEADPRTGRRHPLLAGLDDAPRVIHGTWRLEVSPRAEFASRPLTLIPSYPDLPMEMVYPRVPRTDVAEVYLREAGAGRVVYFPWDIDRTFWEVLAVDHGLLLGNAVRWATAEEPPVVVEGPGVLDVTALAAGGLADGAPGQPDQPDDDEGPVPRAHPGRRAAGGGPAPRRREGEPGPATGGGARGAGRAGRPAAGCDGAVGAGPGGRGGRSLRSRPSGVRGDSGGRHRAGRCPREGDCAPGGRGRREHRPGVEVDAAVGSVLGLVGSHHGAIPGLDARMGVPKSAA